MKKFRYAFFFLFFAALSIQSPSSFADTYTYLRCFYRIDESNLKPATTYVWGWDSEKKDYYHINGYWYNGASMSNMFYSSTTQDELHSACVNTLKINNIDKPLAMYAAADSTSSINYTVWTKEAAEQEKKINKIVAFGDSLSDTQNLFNASLWKMPITSTYYAGRFSNGKNWLDYVSEDLNLPVFNWATGGAGAYDYAAIGPAIVIPGVGSQVASWKSYMKGDKNYKPANTLFTVMIGENDLANYNREVSDVITAEESALIALIGAGAKNILLINLPDVSRAPIFKQREKQDAELAHQKVLLYNYRLKLLANDLKAINGNSVNIQLFDSYSLVEMLLESPHAFGFTNVDESCLNINSDTISSYLYTWYPRAGDADPTNNCTDADTFVFWDLLHPTTKAHKLMSEILTEYIRATFNVK